MLRAYILLALVCFTTATQAQSDIKLSSYNLAPLAYNPAYAGSYGGLSVTSYYSSQWVGFDGAPKTIFANAHGTFFNEQTGLGLEVINDEIGVTTDTKILGNYAYRIQLNYDWKLAMGIKAGVSTFSVDYGKLGIENPNEIYNSQEISTWTNYNIGIGFYLSNDTFYAGLSIPNMLKNSVFDLYNNTQANSTPNYYISSGYKFELDQDIYLQPSILARVVKGAPVNTLIATNLNWKDKFYGSVNLDLSSSVGGFAGFRVAEKFLLGYSYDSSITNFSSSNNGIHSFFLNIRLEDYSRNEPNSFYTF